jgi:hypothetical protein
MINDGGSNSVSTEVTKLVGQLPPAVQALTGVDLSKVNGLCLLSDTQDVTLDVFENS